MSIEEDYGSCNSANHSTQHIHQDGDRQKSRSRITQGAAIAGGITGLMVAGPVLGIVAAAGAAAVASQNDGVAGKVARVSGDAVVTVGDTVKEIDGKYHIVDKSKSFIGTAVHKTMPVLQKTGYMIGNLFKTK